jgi:hypothetical protein
MQGRRRSGYVSDLEPNSALGRTLNAIRQIGDRQGCQKLFELGLARHPDRHSKLHSGRAWMMEAHPKEQKIVHLSAASDGANALTRSLQTNSDRT